MDHILADCRDLAFGVHLQSGRHAVQTNSTGIDQGALQQVRVEKMIHCRYPAKQLLAGFCDSVSKLAKLAH